MHPPIYTYCTKHGVIGTDTDFLTSRTFATMHDVAIAYPVTTMPWLRFLDHDQGISRPRLSHWPIFLGHDMEFSATTRPWGENGLGFSVTTRPWSRFLGYNPAMVGFSRYRLGHVLVFSKPFTASLRACCPALLGNLAGHGVRSLRVWALGHVKSPVPPIYTYCTKGNVTRTDIDFLSGHTFPKHA